MRLLIPLLLLALAGCHRAAKSPADPAPVDPNQKLYDQVRRGSFNLTAAVTDLGQVTESLKDIQAKAPKGGELADSLDDIANLIDGCGADIADFTAEPPAFDEFKAHLPDNQDRLKKAIAAATDAWHELNDAWGEVDAILDAPPKKLESDLEDLSGDMEDVSDDLKAAIISMGGTPPKDDSDDDSTDLAG